MLYSGHEEDDAHQGKSKVLKINAARTSSIIVEGKVLEETDNFSNLSSIVDKNGGTEAGVRDRIGKARITFLQLRNIWS